MNNTVPAPSVRENACFRDVSFVNFGIYKPTDNKNRVIRKLIHITDIFHLNILIRQLQTLDQIAIWIIAGKSLPELLITEKALPDWTYQYCAKEQSIIIYMSRNEAFKTWR